ncbi:GMC oxidoreductase [Mameliella alba]|uniref:GMC oxidoreductase n=1 Tax=Mameliella alba TaxID=561184 RepID=UPI000B52E73E|nr:GMC family oxidoreductase [Mameliella alba]MBY6121181.1 GMC family oxidoreductase [Mameliella alba]OWV41522.1 glucose-methanol-choline oxidoreductase [Mameliella alba]OWV61518.1 glucose-methanol-choline oxidoreductase [Mameliella alba]
MTSLFETDWDAIVIGAGMGGGTLGRALAEAGQKVLFVEKGAEGLRSERNGLTEVFVPEARAARGLWPDPLHVSLDGVETQFFAPLGSGPGGSSVFYAATLERPERHDLDDLPGQPHPTGGWPVGFDEMAPWYDRAARQFRVHGTPDPLSPETPMPLDTPPPLHAAEAALTDSLRAAGLHPYRTHTGIARVEGCENCLGKKCPKLCKMDGRSAGVEPALATGNAHMLSGVAVTRLVSDGTRITGAEIRIDGETRTLRARRYILAAGALHSPRLLLASASEAAPRGLANSSGLVGCNLMLHVDERFALWPKRGVPDSGATKAISFRDFYHREDMRLGAVQAMGIRASYGEMVHFLNRMFDLRGQPRLRALSRPLAAVAKTMLGHAHLFVGLMEDFPYAHNRVLFDPASPEKLAVTYTLSDELRSRRRAFRKALRRGLRGHRHLFLSMTPELNWGHPCGTLRFGHDPASSVTRADGRAHDLQNLWVADAGFMPTSMGVNPSLTIASNALRVASHILEDQR